VVFLDVGSQDDLPAGVLSMIGSVAAITAEALNADDNAASAIAKQPAQASPIA